MRPERRTPLLVLAVCALLSFMFSTWRSWGSTTVYPTPPPDVCPLVRPQTFDILAPQHGPLTASRYDGYPGLRSSACAAEGVSPVDGSPVILRVWLTHYGRFEGVGPSCVDGGGATPNEYFNRRITGQLPLGDGAGYSAGEGPDIGRYRIDLSICLGTYRVLVQYEVAGVAVDDMIEATSAVGMEVLSKRTGGALFPPLRHWPIILGTLP